VRVLRLAAGDRVTVVDGAGGTYVVELEEAGGSRVTGRVLESVRELGESARRLSVGLGLLRNRNRFETFLEKAVELGVDRIVPLRTARTQKQRMRRDRAESILVSAMKQSGRSRLPELTEIRAIGEECAAGGSFVRLICHVAAANAEHILETDLGIGPVHVLIGPEGGFTDGEIDEAAAAGYRRVWMGERRLRAETAAVLAAGALRFRMDVLADS
jgi:16S rRNA (uracil1498-N3)-methyltransferase